jgi:hypothetical protein
MDRVGAGVDVLEVEDEPDPLSLRDVAANSSSTEANSALIR